MKKPSCNGRALKVHVDPNRNTVMVRSVERWTVNSPMANCHGVTRDDGQWASTYVELDGERKRTNDLY
jgi:hypothetical protein